MASPLEVPLDGQPIVRGSWDERGELAYLIDTGAQIFSFDSDLTEGNVSFFTAELGTPTARICGAIVKGRDLSEAEAYIGVNIDALFGQSALKALYAFIDYRDLRAWIYDRAPDVAPPGMDGVEPFVLPFELQNELPVGTIGLGDDAQGEAIELPLLTDTGSGVTIVTERFFARVEAAHGEALPRLEGYKWATNFGFDDSFITRLPVMKLGEVEVEGEWVVVIPDRHHIRTLLEGSAVFVEGFLGYPHYRHFLLEADGPNSRFRLWPYPDDSHLPAGEWHRVGIELTARPGGLKVEMIFRPSDAAEQDIQLDDTLLSIDGMSLAGLSLDAVRGLLRGQPGERRALIFSREGEDEPVAVDALVEDLLPPLAR